MSQELCGESYEDKGAQKREGEREGGRERDSVVSFGEIVRESKRANLPCANLGGRSLLTLLCPSQ